MKLYVDTTGELVLDNGWEHRYPAFCEIQRIEAGSDYLRLESISTNRILLDATIYSDIQDSGGTPYASFAALKAALDNYFDDTL